MTKELLSYIPKVYRNSIIDFYKDQDGYWLSLIKFNKKGRVFYESMYLSWPFSS